MTQADALLAELTDLEIRCVAAGAARPGDAEITQLRRDIQQRRAAVIEALALLRHVNDDDGVTLH